MTAWLRVDPDSSGTFSLFRVASIELDDDDMQALYDEQVEATDAIKAFCGAHLRLPVVVGDPRRGGEVWIGGVSARGNLVGAWTFKFES